MGCVDCAQTLSRRVWLSERMEQIQNKKGGKQDRDDMFCDLLTIEVKYLNLDWGSSMGLDRHQESLQT